MAKKTKKIRSKSRKTPASASAAPSDLVLYGILPGVLMYRRPYPAGVPDTHSSRSAHVHAVATASVFSAIREEERGALFDSLAKTVRRAEYHRARYADLRLALDRRREGLPGHVFWDEFVEALHSELKAFCGAARTVLDELVYLVARRHGIAAEKARKSPWDALELITKPLPAKCQVPEVDLARLHRGWFELLNSYRNTIFHHGWRHGSGHFSTDDLRSSAKNPAANALLVPDLASLGDRSRPHERSYNDGTTTDDVMFLAQKGLDELLRSVFEGTWATPQPSPGKVPRAEQPNMMVMLASPALFIVHDLVVIPFFTTAENAHAFGVPGPNVELVACPAVYSVIGQRAVTFTVKGLELTALPANTRSLKVLIDPVSSDATWRDIKCVAALEIGLLEGFDPMQPISLQVADVDRLFVWGSTDTRAWIGTSAVQDETSSSA